jgi:ABC-type spermidine/putrescine transport system permease subunit I
LWVAFYGISDFHIFFSKVFSIVHFKIIITSLLLALSVATTCFIVAYPVAYWIARHMRRFKIFFLFLLAVPFWTNILILSYAWILLLERHGIITSFFSQCAFFEVRILNSFWAIFIVSVYCYLPFMIFPLYSALEKVDQKLLEASADLGASGIQTFFNIIIPLSLPGIRAGFLLVLIPMYGEFAIPALVGGDKYMLIGNTIAHYVFVTFDFALATGFTIFSLVVLLFALLVLTVLTQGIINYRRIFYEQ